MDPLSGVASVIAVIQITDRVVSLCSKCLKDVKDAKSNIERLLGELGSLKVVLEGAQRLLEEQIGTRLKTLQLLRGTLDECSSQLKDLENKLKEKLETGKRGKAMSRFGFRALKWPFESKDVDGIIQTLKQFQDTLPAALIIDQTYVADSSLEIALLLTLLPLERFFSTISNASTARNGSGFWNGSHPSHTETITRRRRTEQPIRANGCYKTRDSVSGRTPVRR
jgi:hypothetical protein